METKIKEKGKTLGRPKKKISEKEQVDGKDFHAPTIKSLSELWGFKDDKFGTNDEETYKKKLMLMNKADLQSACIKIGLMPHDNRQIMMERLLTQFRQHITALKTINIQPMPVPKVTDASEKLRSWMAAAGGNTLV